MADIEKVIKGINCHIKKDCRGNACPYANVYACEFVLLNDALELLKEQTVKPFLIREGKNKHYNDYHCPRCDEEIVYEQNYCSECGSRIDWSN